ncbi:hypothetical protein LTR10_001254 [Elasticomyces elasticus]|nr:hypothetical protein LTR10_001254 [Elasticomyces elasticus]KAK4965379.1 hypothetical protein LTR42_012135 [Elasticomyces elasticus]
MARDTDPIANRCKRYKAGTNKLIRWLYIKTVAASAGQSVTTTPSTQDLLRQAETIVAAKPKIEIPLEIIVITEDVIEGRQVCADWYSANEDGADEERERQNSSHRNFIAVLRQILNTLQHAYDERASRGKKVKPAVAAVSKAEVLRNLYDYLDIEQPSATPMETASAPPSQLRTSSGKAVHVPEIHVRELEDADKAFAVYCFFRDQYDVVQYLKRAWDQHIAGKMSFCAVCELTNSGFLLMQKASDVFILDNPTLAHMLDVIEFLGLHVGAFAEGVTVLSVRQKRVNADAHSSPALHELFFIRAFRVMVEFTVCLLSKEASPAVSRAHKHKLTTALQAMAPQFLLLYRAGKLGEVDGSDDCPRPIGPDVFLNGLMECVWTRGVAPWLVMACDVYTYIYDLLGNHVTEGFDMLHNDSSRLKQRQASLSDFAALLEEDSPLPRNSMQYFQMKFVQYVESDLVNDLRKKDRKTDLRGALPPYHMQKLLPISCGHTLYTQHQALHVAGIKMCNAGHVVITAAHLYTAARYCGIVKGQWRDMDWFMAHHGAKRPIVLESKGSVTPLESLAKHYRITLGGKLAKKKEKAAGNANSWTWSHAAGPPHRVHYAELPTIGRTFLDGRTIDTSNSSPYLQHMSTKSNCEGFTTGTVRLRDIQEQAMHKVAIAALERQAASQSAGKRNHGAGTRKLSAVQVLESFADMLKEDELNLNFDYLAFARSCYGLLTVLHRKYKPMGDSDVLNIPPMANILLWELASTEKGLALEHTMMFQARDLLQQHLDDHGASYLDDAQTRCSSHMSLPLQVSNTEVGELTAPPLPMLHLDGLEKLRSLYLQQGIEFHADVATRIIMLYNPEWKTDRNAMQEVLYSLAAEALAVEALINASDIPEAEEILGPDNINVHERVSAWKEALRGRASLGLEAGEAHRTES